MLHGRPQWLIIGRSTIASLARSASAEQMGARPVEEAPLDPVSRNPPRRRAHRGFRRYGHPLGWRTSSAANWRSTTGCSRLAVTAVSSPARWALPSSSIVNWTTPRISSTSSLGNMSSKRSTQEATFLILIALAAGSQHGYGIITDVIGISGGRVRLRAGTLYTALDRLRADGLIEVDHEEVVDNRLRRYYRLTSAGVERLADEAARLQSNAHVAMSRLDLSGGLVST
jgi:PadR family transcriptional regulator